MQPGFCAQPQKDLRPVAFNGGLGNTKRGGNFLVSPALRCQPQDFALARGKWWAWFHFGSLYRMRFLPSLYKSSMINSVAFHPQQTIGAWHRRHLVIAEASEFLNPVIKPEGLWPRILHNIFFIFRSWLSFCFPPAECPAPPAARQANLIRNSDAISIPVQNSDRPCT